MSYCRMSEGDVYMYPDISGGIVCCGCRFVEGFGTRFYSRSEALAHLELHIERGDIVPAHAIERLKREIEKIGDKVEFED